MNPFEFFIPQNITVGAGTLAKLPECAKKLGGSHAMLISGPTLRKMGVVDKAADYLKDAGMAVDIFTDVEANPSVTTVEKATEAYKDSGADFIVALGGGSPMDVAKAVGVTAKYGGSITEYEGAHKVPGKIVPLIAIPTTAGTGSEVTPYAILTRIVMPKIELTTAAASETSTEAKAGELVKQSISHHIFPELALVDSTYLQTASKTGCINTAVDTLAHLVESHLNTNATPYSRVYSEMGLRTFAKVKDALASYEIGEAQRELLMQACTLGGMAISHTGTSLPHGLSYRVTCELGTPHGKAVGMFLPGFLRCYGDQEEAMRVLTLLGFGSHQSFEAYIYSLIGEEKISRELWERTMNDLLSNPAKLKNYPFQMDREKLNGLR